MRRFFQTIFAVLLVATAPAYAEPQTPSPQSREAELQAARQEARNAAQMGPMDIPLAGEAVLHLPAGMAFIPAAQAGRLMVALGNSVENNRLGLIVPTGKDQEWLADLAWTHEGHVPDGDAKDWQPDAMLSSLRQGTEQQNKVRIQQGIPALDIVGWVEPPAYQAATHRLIWSLSATDRGAPADAPQSINYNTYVLGREGYISLDMISSSRTIAHDKPLALALLGDIAFNSGKRYQDFNPSTDRVAEYGLAALVGVVAAKKLGLIAIIAAFALKIWKVVLVFVLGGWAALRRRLAGLFGRKQTVAPDALSVDHSGPAPTSAPDDGHSE